MVGWGLAMALLVFGVAVQGNAAADTQSLVQDFEALTEDVKTHRAAKDIAALTRDLQTAVKLHAAAEGKATLRKKVITLIGNVPKRMNDNTLRCEVLKALGATGDPLAARFVRFYLRQANRKKASKVLLTAIGTAGQIPTGSLVSPLLKILDKSKHMGAAAQALESLGNYRGVKSHRVRILKEIVISIRRSRPGVKGDMKDPVEGDMHRHSGEAMRDRWSALATRMPRVLGKLTGVDSGDGSCDDWFTMYDDHKRNLRGLFVDDE